MSDVETIPQRYLDQAVALDHLMYPPEEVECPPYDEVFMREVVNGGLDAVGLVRPEALTPNAQRAAKLLGRFEYFAPLVDEFLSNNQEHPDFVELSPRSGMHSRGYEFYDPIYGEMVLRVPKTNQGKISEIVDKTIVQLLLNGLRYTENVVASSFDVGVTVARKVPGVQIPFVPEIKAVATKKQVENLAETIVGVSEAGVHRDIKATNIFYTPDSSTVDGGFYLIDMGPGLLRDDYGDAASLGILTSDFEQCLSAENIEVFARHAAAILPKQYRKEILDRFGVSKK